MILKGLLHPLTTHAYVSLGNGYTGMLQKFTDKGNIVVVFLIDSLGKELSEAVSPYTLQP